MGNVAARAMHVTRLLAPLAVLSALAVALPATAPGSIPLATFDGSPATNWTWEAVSDPVMGGQSYANLTVKDSTLEWQGEVKIVPFLKAPGFCNAQAPGMGHTAQFPNIEGTHGLTSKRVWRQRACSHGARRSRYSTRC